MSNGINSRRFSRRRFLKLGSAAVVVTVAGVSGYFMFRQPVANLATAAPATTPTPTPTYSLQLPLRVPEERSEVEFEEKVFSLLDFDVTITARGRETIRSLAKTKDERLIVPFIELHRFSGYALKQQLNQALQDITGENYETWSDWIIYISNRDEVALPPGFLRWKGKKLSFVDPNFQRFFYEGATKADFFRPELAVWGGVRVAISPGVDIGIPPLEEPKTVLRKEAAFMRDDDRVFGIFINGKARAYPQRIIDWHEMVNDVINDQHFTIAYCTLCQAAIAYDTRLPDGSYRTFSSSGMLYESNKLMFDRQTQTLWNQLLGEPVLGPLVEEVKELPLLPIETTKWKDWLQEHPDTDVIDIDTGFFRDYSDGNPSYNRYYLSNTTLFPTSDVRGPLKPKDRIFGLVEEGFARAYERNMVWEEKVINDMFGDRTIVVVSKGKGFGIKAFERNEHAFSLAENAFALVDENDTPWEITDETLVSGIEQLARLPAHEAFWFGWVINYPDTTVYP